MTAALRLVFADHLSRSISSLRDLDPERDVVLMAEVADEATYVPHHPKKIAFLFSAMRHFAQALEAEGIRVDYRRLDDFDNRGSFREELVAGVERHRPERVVVTEPGEWRVLEDMRGWEKATGLAVEIQEDDRFFCSQAAFARWAMGRRQLRMEHFYRAMRERTGLLMEAEGEPAGDRWNFDAENRKPAKGDLDFPAPSRFEPDATTWEVIELVRERFADNFGEVEPFWFAVTREQAAGALDHFVEAALPRFGDYQDAMRAGEDFLFHSVLSQYLNAGLLLPREVCGRVEEAWRRGRVPLNSAEGFIRQILGWREYVRGIYWQRMPGLAKENHLGNRRPLPALYWTGETPMRCLASVIDQTRREALSHHIQRLMVTGNFALLVGVRPEAICAWYLAVYADAFEWVELPNTLGMAMFADGGLLASKPYAASGNYINKMSDFCAGCSFDVRQKTGPEACPFNYLYWSFLMENRSRLEGNPRLGPVYRTLDRLGEDRRKAIRRDTATFLDGLYPDGGGAHG